MGKIIRLSLYCLSLVGLSLALIYVNKQNAQLRRDLAAAFDATQSRVGACILPPLISETAAAGSLELTFPRPRPLLVLSARRDCPRCRFALQAWTKLISRYPNRVDSLIYDGGRSYSPAELQQSGVDPRAVLTTRTSISPYRELLNWTPSVMLVGRSGRVLALWNGELSQERVDLIQSTIQDLMMTE